MTKLSELATVVRSKNAEPYLTTIDIYFPDDESYARVRDSGALTAESVAETYNIPEEAVYGIYFVDGVNAAKVTLFKYNGGYLGLGDPELGDIFGAQQHVPLLDMDIDEVVA
ncbi:MAG: DUF4387 domain-containing protein [Thermoleophilaceae bacterium]